jgi:hypothetical protein
MRVLEKVVDPATRPDDRFLASVEERWHTLRSRVIAVQEELDGRVYIQYGLVDRSLTLRREADRARVLDRLQEASFMEQQGRLTGLGGAQVVHPAHHDEVVAAGVDGMDGAVDPGERAREAR